MSRRANGGRGTNLNAYFPRLAGKPAGYLANQLLALFHAPDAAHYPPMNYLLA